MSILRTKSYSFALKIVQRVGKFQKEEKEYVLSKQLLRSGTGIGALIEEAGQAESRKDFIHKLSIASKEANEIRYWLRLLRDSGLYSKFEPHDLLLEIEELIKMLVASIKTAKST